MTGPLGAVSLVQVAIAPWSSTSTGLAMNLNHDMTTCTGCDAVLHLDDLAAWLGESVHTLYKWAAIGYPAFPKRMRLRNKHIVVTCRMAKAWALAIVA